MRAYTAAILAALLALAGCVSTPRNYDYDESYDFEAVETFAMEPRKRTNKLNPEISDMTYDRIEDALIDTLRGLGLTRVGKQDNPDVVVHYTVVTSAKQDVWAYAPEYEYQCYQCELMDEPENRTDDYNVGTLYVDLVDPRENRAVWHGVASEEVKEKRTPNQRKELVRGVIEKMFSGFPPETKGSPDAAEGDDSSSGEELVEANEEPAEA